MRGWREYLSDEASAKEYGLRNGYHYVIAESKTEGNLSAFRFFKHFNDMHAKARQLLRQGNPGIICLTGKRIEGGVTDEESSSESEPGEADSLENEDDGDKSAVVSASDEEVAKVLMEAAVGNDAEAAHVLMEGAAAAAVERSGAPERLNEFKAYYRTLVCEKVAEERGNLNRKRKRTGEGRESRLPIDSKLVILVVADNQAEFGIGNCITIGNFHSPMLPCDLGGRGSAGDEFWVVVGGGKKASAKRGGVLSVVGVGKNVAAKKGLVVVEVGRVKFANGGGFADWGVLLVVGGGERARGEFLADIYPQPKAWVEDEEDEAARGRLARSTGETSQSVLDKLLRSETLKKSFGGVFSRNKERGEGEGVQVTMSDFTGRLSSAEVKALDFMEALPEPEGLLLAATCMRLAQEEPMATNLARLLFVQEPAASAVVIVSPRKKAAPKGHQVAVLEAAILAVPPCPLALEGDLTIDVMSLLKIQPSALLDNSKFRADSIEAGNVRAILNWYGRWVIETRKLAVSKPNVVTTGVAVLFDDRSQSEARYASRTVAPIAEAFMTDGELAAAVLVEAVAEYADIFGDEVEKSPKTVKTGHNVVIGRMLLRAMCVYRSASLRHHDLRTASFSNPRAAAFLLWSSSKLLNAIPSVKGEGNVLAVARRSAYAADLTERYERKKQERKQLLAGNVYTRERDPLRHQSAEELVSVLDFIDNVVGTGDVKKLRRLGLMARRLRGVSGFPLTSETPLSGRVGHPGLCRDIPGRLGMTSYEALTYFYRNEVEVIAGDSALVLLSSEAANSYPSEEERMEMAHRMLDESSSQPLISGCQTSTAPPSLLAGGDDE